MRPGGAATTRIHKRVARADRTERRSRHSMRAAERHWSRQTRVGAIGSVAKQAPHRTASRRMLLGAITSAPPLPLPEMLASLTA